MLSLCPLSAATQPAPAYNYSEILSNFNKRLTEARTPQDSISLLNNIFDIAQASLLVNADSIARITYETALRANDYTSAYEMLRMRANSNHRKNEVLNYLYDEAVALPEHPDKNETITFIEILRNNYAARYASAEERDRRFNEELKEYTVNPPSDLFGQIKLLHSVCANLAEEAQGEVLEHYMVKLGQLIDSVPTTNFTLRNTFNSQAAMLYSIAGHADRAIEADRNLLEIMDSLSAHYERIGRPYRTYGGNRYIVYTRMLGSWPMLSGKEVEDYYAQTKKYRDEDPRARNTYQTVPLPDIYYAMATKDYPKALQLLKKYINHPSLQSRRRLMLRHLITAAEAVGDKETLLAASRENDELLEEYLNNRMRERYKELQLVYDINNINNKYASLKSEKLANESSMHRWLIILTISAVVVLLILLLVIVRLYRRSKRLANTLAESNEALKKESESLRTSQQELTRARDAAQEANQFKSAFMKNMGREIAVPLAAINEYSHLIVDCSDANDLPYLERYAEQVELNINYLNAIINDVMHLSEIETITMSVNRELVDLRKVAELAVDTIRPAISPSVEIVFDDKDSVNPDTYTDPRRFQQILVNVLGNAAKYTSTGHIFLECSIINDGKTIAIAVTDTGCGIPKEAQEHVFERFYKIDPDAKGAGLGLPISRMLARLLGGDLVLDTTYTRGARFILTLPYVLI